MTRISVDDQISELSEPNRKTGEILHNVLSNLPANRIVTRILLDGKQLAQIPQDALTTEGGGGIKELEIRTVDREIWSINGFDIAISSLERVQKSLIRVAELFREENKSQANQFFVHCVDGLERFFEALMITRCARGLDFNLVSYEGRKLSQIEHEFAGILKTIIDSQERRDFIDIADRVEYELIPNLSTWMKALNQLRLSLISNA